jgi:hypothetical protein
MEDYVGKITKQVILSKAIAIWALTREITHGLTLLPGLEEYALKFRREFEPLFHDVLDEPTIPNLLKFANRWKETPAEINAKLAPFQ